MLKTLRITSLIALVAAVCGVVAIGAIGLRGDSDILAFLDKPGVVDAAKGDESDDTDPKDVESPLVTQSKLFALRIDPPPPPKPKVEKTPEPVKPKEVVKRERPKSKVVTPPGPTVQVNAKFTLLGTVLCESDPTRSMALLQQSTGKQEWFRQGERIGHLDVQEVRDGSVLFSQNGRNSQQLFVPEKPKVKSLLKDASTATTTSRTGPGSINVTLGPEPTEPVVGGVTAATAGPSTASPSGRPTTTDSGRVRIERSKAETEARQAAADRVRTRVAPKVRTPKEQKASIEGNISSIQEIMSRDSGVGDDKQKQQENEAWLKLLKALEGEKESLDTRMKEETETKPEPEPDAAPKRR